MKSEVYNIYENERSPVLIAKFKNGFASDFFFEIPESFKDSLDIKWTEKTVDKNGLSSYNFSSAIKYPYSCILHNTQLEGG